MENNKKIKILVFVDDMVGGCGYYRSMNPHIYLAQKYPDKFEVDVEYELPTYGNVLPYFIQYDIIHFHRYMDNSGQLLQIAKQMGKITICDVDDYWFLGSHHPIGLKAQKEKWHEPVLKHIKNCDYVSTTTHIFAQEIKKYNKHTVVFPNAIDATEPQFIPNDTYKGKRIRVGLICGSSHLHDIQLLDGINKQLSQEVKDKIQWVICGFDTRGMNTIIMPDGTQRQEPIDPKSCVWANYERILTNNYEGCSPAYKNYLLQYTQTPYTGNTENEPYARYWTKPIDSYATHYNNIDILLAPLVECDFNKFKSQLKETEAGVFHKAIIAEDYGAYQIDLISAIDKGGQINPQGNALLVNPSKNHKQWAKHITRIVEDEQLRKTISDNLHQLYLDKYTIDKVVDARARFYEKIVEEKNNKKH